MGISSRYSDCLHYSDNMGYLTFCCQNVVSEGAVVYILERLWMKPFTSNSSSFMS